MSDPNDKNQSEEPGTVSQSRRAFMVSTTTAVVGVGAANLLIYKLRKQLTQKMLLPLKMTRTPWRVWPLILRLVRISS